MANNSKSYGESSISSLKKEQQVRERPSVIFGTANEEGAAHAVCEILANSIDEARSGFGNQIRMRMEEDGTILVSDDGRGVPMDWNEKEGKYNWELVFCTLYASGKYNSAAYNNSLGLNGLGATATQYVSEFMQVCSTYGGKSHLMNFKKGVPVGEMQVVPALREGTGTDIKFKIDKSVFIGIDKEIMPLDYWLHLLRRQSMLLAGLEIKFWHYQMNKEISISFPNGESDYLETCENTILKKCLVFEDSASGSDIDDASDPYEVHMKATINFSRQTSVIEMYHNTSYLFEGGVTLEALKKGITSAFDGYGHDTNKLNKNEHIQYQDIEGILLCVGVSDADGYRTMFKNQVKSAITNPYIGKAYRDFIYTNMRNWLKTNKEADRIMGEVLANKKAREEAEKVSKRVVSSLSKSLGGLGGNPKKFVNCTSKDVFERELYIVEGDSALGSCKLSRNSKYQAIMPVRGKILNCLKESLSRILSSDIIVDLIRVFGCGIQAESKYINDLPKFDINNLNWGKIIICTDADIDGMQIRCLILTMIYRLCPDLIKYGKVYIAETPLFEIINKKDVMFAYSDNERDEILKDLTNQGVNLKNVTVNRSKGLGENDPEMMNKSTMNPLTRRLIPVDYNENSEFVQDCFNALLGTDIESRRELIEYYFKATENAE